MTCGQCDSPRSYGVGRSLPRTIRTMGAEESDVLRHRESKAKSRGSPIYCGPETTAFCRYCGVHSMSLDPKWNVPVPREAL